MSNIATLKEQIHKKGVNSGDWDLVSSNTRVLAYEFIDYCSSRGLHCEFTGIIFQPLLCSTSDIHSKKRAFDVSTHGWTLEQILACEKYFNEIYADDIGAVTKSGKRLACYFESPEYNGKGTGPHLHFQVRPVII